MSSSAKIAVPVWKTHGALIAALVGLGLFAWLPLSYYRWVAWPWVLIWQGAFLLGWGWLLGRVRQSQQPAWRLGYGLDWWLGLSALGLIVSAIAAPFKMVAAWNVLLAVSYGVLLYALHQALLSKRFPAIALWRGSAIAVVGSALISLAYWRPSLGMWQSTSAFADTIRNLQPLGHHNFTGGYFTLGLPLVLALALAEKNRLRWLAVLGAVIVALGIYASGSRGALLGVFIWLVVTLLSKVWRSRSGRRRWYILGGLAGISAMILVLLSNPRIRNSLQAIMTGQWSDLTQLSGADGPLVDRVFLAIAGFNLFRDRPWVGVGPGNLSRLFNLYRAVEAGDGFDHTQQLHSTPVHFWGEMGLIGLGIYLTFGLLIIRLWLRVVRQLPEEATWQRTLAYGIGGSFLAYAVSSLTDYQLENSPIALTLLVNVGLLLAIAHSLESPEPPTLDHRWRKLSSVGLLAFVVILLRVWVPFDAALALDAAGLEDFRANRLEPAQAKFFRASQIAPWDPTASALAAQQLIRAEPTVGESELLSAFQQGILLNLRNAVEAAPNDAVFNSNLAVRYLSIDAARAEAYASRSIKLLPRSPNHAHYTLGLSYLNQQKRDQAIAAFAVEGLMTPTFTTRPLWQITPFDELALTVVDRTLTLYDNLLAQVSPEQAVYRSLYEQAQLLRWWHDRPLLPSVDGLSDKAQILLTIETAPDRSFDLANQAIAQAQSAGIDPPLGLLLLRAWLQPDDYLDDFLAVARDTYDAATVDQIRDRIVQVREFRPWITALVEEPDAIFRQGLAFTYRNREASFIRTTLQADGLTIYTLLDLIQPFSGWPREFPALDRLVETVTASELGLPHPTHNGFRLPVELPPPPDL